MRGCVSLCEIKVRGIKEDTHKLHKEAKTKKQKKLVANETYTSASRSFFFRLCVGQSIKFKKCCVFEVSVT